MMFNASWKYGMERADLTLKIIADYSKEVYGEGGSHRGVPKSQQERKQQVISFFEGKVEELGLVEFL